MSSIQYFEPMPNNTTNVTTLERQKLLRRERNAGIAEYLMLGSSSWKGSPTQDNLLQFQPKVIS